MKDKKFIKKALKKPELLSEGEIQYLELMQRTLKEQKKREKVQKLDEAREQIENTFNQTT